MLIYMRPGNKDYGALFKQVSRHAGLYWIRGWFFWGLLNNTRSDCFNHFRLLTVCVEQSIPQNKRPEEKLPACKIKDKRLLRAQPAFTKLFSTRYSAI